MITRAATRLTQWAVRSTTGAAAILALSVVAVTARGLAPPIDARGGDLAPLVAGARLLARGQASHLYDHDDAFVHIANSPEIVAAAGDATSVGSINPLAYPPVFAWLARPLAAVPFRVTWVIWGWTVSVAAAASILLAWRLYGRRSDPRPLLVLAVALPLLQPYRSLLRLGNVMSLIALALVGAAGLQRRGRSVAAGLVLSVPVALKLSPAVLALPWLLRGDRAALRALAIGWAGWLGLSAVVAGPDAVFAYFASLSYFGGATVVAWNNHSLTAFWHRWEYPRAAAWTWGVMQKQPLAVLATTATIVLGVALVVAAARRAPRPLRENARALVLIEALALAAITLLPTFAWSHYFFLLAPGFFVTSVGASRAERGALLGALALLCDPLAPDQTRPTTWSANALVAGHTFSALVVAGLLIRRLRSAFEDPAPTAEG